jgi:hypothetical protein
MNDNLNLDPRLRYYAANALNNSDPEWSETEETAKAAAEEEEEETETADLANAAIKGEQSEQEIGGEPVEDVIETKADIQSGLFLNGVAITKVKDTRVRLNPDDDLALVQLLLDNRPLFLPLATRIPENHRSTFWETMVKEWLVLKPGKPYQESSMKAWVTRKVKKRERQQEINVTISGKAIADTDFKQLMDLWIEHVNMTKQDSLEARQPALLKKAAQEITNSKRESLGMTIDNQLASGIIEIRPKNMDNPKSLADRYTPAKRQEAAAQRKKDTKRRIQTLTEELEGDPDYTTTDISDEEEDRNGGRTLQTSSMKAPKAKSRSRSISKRKSPLEGLLQQNE